MNKLKKWWVHTGNLAADILGLKTERAIASLVTEGVGSIVVNLVDVLQNRHDRFRSGGSFGLQSSACLLASAIRKSDSAGDEKSGNLWIKHIISEKH